MSWPEKKPDLHSKQWGHLGNCSHPKVAWIVLKCIQRVARRLEKMLTAKNQAKFVLIIVGLHIETVKSVCGLRNVDQCLWTAGRTDLTQNASRETQASEAIMLSKALKRILDNFFSSEELRPTEQLGDWLETRRPLPFSLGQDGITIKLRATASWADGLCAGHLSVSKMKPVTHRE